MEWTKDKKKLIFMGMVLFALLFIGAYGILTFGGGKEPFLEKGTVTVPELEKDTETYKSRLEAVDALEDERETTVPSVYPEKYLDSSGYYNKNLSDMEKKRIMDSVYELGKQRYQKLHSYRSPTSKAVTNSAVKKREQSKKEQMKERAARIKELALAHQLFFASNPKTTPALSVAGKQTAAIPVTVKGTQRVKAHERLALKLEKAVTIGRRHFKRHTPVYGMVSFKPNRTLLRIDNITGIPIAMTAYDLQDGGEGIYIKNSFREQARKEVLGDVVEDINIAGLPQVNGIKRIFQRNNRKVKVTVHDNYHLLLKPTDH
ncbi:conjugative transposon protein TraM [Galbibacter sp. PAP.153]|uniref:conjugative transposon protein TraM n=1 Tax=Galbibacter sp. PAP.153 TaxID=3104623 RepID=UPI003009DFDD